MWNILWNEKSLTQCHVDQEGSGPVIRLSWFSLQKETGCPKGDRESNKLNGQGIKKLLYQNFTGMSFWNTGMKWNLICDVDIYCPPWFYYFKLSLCDIVMISGSCLNHLSQEKCEVRTRKGSNNCLVSTMSPTIDFVWILKSITVWIFHPLHTIFFNRILFTLYMLFHSPLIQNMFHCFIGLLHKNGCLEKI